MILICYLNNFTQIYINIYYLSTLYIYFVTAYAKVLPTNNPNIILEKCVFIFLFKQQASPIYWQHSKSLYWE